jgi:hypothetical protein
MEVSIDYYFNKVVKNLEKQFGEDIDMQGILFLIGVQELGKGKIKLSKSEKLDVMHVAICSLLAPFGYYEFEGYDSDGWPHWKANEKLPALKPAAQQQLMKQAVVDYFKANDLLVEETIG